MQTEQGSKFTPLLQVNEIFKIKIVIQVSEKSCNVMVKFVK